jgi:alpha-tubulin suppressor-like RCC1 family protein
VRIRADQPLVKNVVSFSTCSDTLVCTMLDGSCLVYSVGDSDVSVETSRSTFGSRVLKTFSGGADMIIVLLFDGTVMVRGSNMYNQLQVPTAAKYIDTWTRGFEQYEADDIKTVEFGSQHVVVLTKSGEACGYGCDEDGQLGVFKQGPLANVQKIQCT